MPQENRPVLLEARLREDAVLHVILPVYLDQEGLADQNALERAGLLSLVPDGTVHQDVSFVALALVTDACGLLTGPNVVQARDVFTEKLSAVGWGGR